MNYVALHNNTEMGKNQHYANDWLNWTHGDWAKWLQEELAKKEQIYEISPDELIASYNREKSHMKEYHGRELLELIQNADDAGLDYEGEFKLSIKLTNNALYVANTGIPFSPEGINSLMISDISPKQFKGLKHIGYKGLGFRSILGWASKIAILSGNASIAFSEKIAANWLAKLKNKSPDVKSKVDDFSAQSGVKNPIATLNVPFLLEEKNTDEALLYLIKEGKEILGEGYDTVICLAFSSPQKTLLQVEEQINSLGSETLLFLKHITLMEIDCSDKKKSWKIERDEDVIMVTPEGDESQIWDLFLDEDKIPKKYLPPEHTTNNKYEIKIAVPTSHYSTPERLFVYFPTKVLFPFPVVAHATFELTTNRQNLIDSETNRYISKKLADLMARSAAKIVKISDPWLALKSFIPHSERNPDLDAFGFFDSLRHQLRKASIVPVTNGRFESALKIKRLRADFNTSLKGNHFQDICLYPPEKYLLDKLDVGYLEYSELVKRLNQVTTRLSVSDRAKIIYLVSDKYKLHNDGTSPDLLLDENEEIIFKDAIAILPPEEKNFSLPPWVPQRIISSELVALLRERFKVSRNRELVHKLSIYNVQEYNLTSIVSSIVAETNKRVKNNLANELSIRKDMIQALWSLYSSMTDTVKFPERVTVILPTRGGSNKPAEELYLGNEYNEGQLTEALYGEIDPHSFITDPTQLGFQNASEEIEEFLRWVGVADKPKYHRKPISDSSFRNYVLSELKLPIKFGEFTITDKDSVPGYYKQSIENVLTVDRLEQVLEKADPHAIIAWLAVNQDIDIWRMKGDENARLRYQPTTRHDWRTLNEQAVKSYPLWVLRNTPWLPTSDGGKKTPSFCSTARVVKELSPIVGYPAVDLEHPLFQKLYLDRTAVINVLSKIGVVPDLDDLPWNSFYNLLLKLPEIDTSGEKARSLYRTLVARNEIDNPPPSGDGYQAFLEKGKMLGKKEGTTNYYPINKLYYNNIIPDRIAEHYPLVEIDRGRGAQKVQKLFGIQQLTIDKVQIKITNYEEHSLNDQFQNEIERLKPFIYALRVDEDTNQRELRSLKRLLITLCKSVTGTIVVDDESIEITIKSGQSINDGNVAYLVSEPEDITSKILHDVLTANAVGEIVTNTFRVDISSEIARLICCPSNRREQLLDLIVGGSGDDRFVRAKELFDVELEEEIIFKPPPVSEPTSEKEIEPEVLPETPEEEDELADEYPDHVGDVVTMEEKHIPSKKREITRRIRINSKPSSSRRPRTFVNPDRAENLAMRFEEDQKRFPLKVSHLQGLETFGCDIISFKTEKDRTTYEGKNYISLIERFIEVKGSSNTVGSIILKGNGFKSAQKFMDKYYLYRVYEDTAGEFDLIELNDPTDEEKAGRLQYEVNPFQSQRSRRWEVIEIKE